MEHIFDYFYIVPTQDKSTDNYNVAEIYGRNTNDTKVTYCNRVDSFWLNKDLGIQGDFENDEMINEPCIKVWVCGHKLKDAGLFTFAPKVVD